MRAVLFVCTANLDRSPTAERLFHRWRDEWIAKSAGTMPALGRNPITQALVDWADMILVMQPVHAEYIHRHFKCDAKKMRVLDIEDKYTKDDPELIRELKKKVRPILKIEDRQGED